MFFDFSFLFPVFYQITHPGNVFHFQVVKSVGDSDDVSCRILLIGQTTSNTSSLTELKIKAVTEVTLFRTPSSFDLSFFIVLLWGEDIFWSQNPIRIGELMRSESRASILCSTHLVPESHLYFLLGSSIKIFVSWKVANKAGSA